MYNFIDDLWLIVSAAEVLRSFFTVPERITTDALQIHKSTIFSNETSTPIKWPYKVWKKNYCFATFELIWTYFFLTEKAKMSNFMIHFPYHDIFLKKGPCTWYTIKYIRLWGSHCCWSIWCDIAFWRQALHWQYLCMSLAIVLHKILDIPLQTHCLYV